MVPIGGRLGGSEVQFDLHRKRRARPQEVNQTVAPIGRKAKTITREVTNSCYGNLPEVFF